MGAAGSYTTSRDHVNKLYTSEKKFFEVVSVASGANQVTIWWATDIVQLDDHDCCRERRRPAVDAVFADVCDENRTDSRVGASRAVRVRRTTHRRNAAWHRLRVPRQKCTDRWVNRRSYRRTGSNNTLTRWLYQPIIRRVQVQVTLKLTLLTVSLLILHVIQVTLTLVPYGRGGATSLVYPWSHTHTHSLPYIFCWSRVS